MKLSLILFISLVLFTIGASANWTKYCRKYKYEENKKGVFVGNPAKTYPHVHCGKNFITFSESNSKSYLAKGGDEYCERIKATATNIDNYYMKDADNAKALVNKLKKDYCEDMSMLKRLLMHLLLEN